ncbi:MAG: dehydrogenase [Lewinellaceae bacterium]|nr:dehydrogenase E1 component subunit alpha/beta [Saprospiraceae bacterium]MCB9312773.1 dehydrogenase [Lewinellaceae bacterium]HRW76003.1 dehydrogenase E1 component subunit alpha/beta [Saprospiraceae bacterium]
MSTLAKDLPAMTFQRKGMNDDELLRLYRLLILPRLIEEKMLILLRQGRISKWFSGIGQEAIAVGTTAALLPDELMFTMHRNLGVFTTREMPLDKLVAQWQGKKTGFSKGRERSFHFGALEYGIVGMISHLGPQLSLAAGVALAHKLRRENRVSLAFTGEGGTSQGEFHEALNVASVWELPVIFVIENNGYGLSTPTNEQYRCNTLADRGIGYGMEAYTIDGNNILEVYQTIHALAESMRTNPRPVLLECMTFRMRGHEEASGTKYVPQELFTLWETKDPVQTYEQWLVNEGLLDEEAISALKGSFKQFINDAVERAFNEPEPVPDIEEELEDVYAPTPVVRETTPSSDRKEMRYIDAISDGLRQGMEAHDNLILMGQDIAEYGGVFKITDGFVHQFGKDRVRNTPLCESAIIGISLGLSFKGFKSMVEMQFADFVTCGFNQIVNNLAKGHYRWGANADVVIRMPAGAGVGAGPFHSQSNEAWFAHTPGLKVVFPATPTDAKGLLLAALDDPNPVMFFEHKALYRAVSEEVPVEPYRIPIGKANLVREGNEVSIITYGMGVHWARKAVEEMGIDADILDLRSLVPLDYEAIETTVRKTSRVILLHEDTLFLGIGGEISAWINEHLFEHLDAPVMRSASLDTPVPFAIPLEQQFLPSQRFRQQLNNLLAY